MAQEKEWEHFATRAELERMMSESALDPDIASIHAQLAASYDRLAEGLGQQLRAPRMPAATPPPSSQESDMR